MKNNIILKSLIKKESLDDIYQYIYIFDYKNIGK